jgi:outer membrane protein, multidrug efflux system
VRRALEVLLGRYPANEIDVAQSYPALAPMSGVGVPSELLERRPDILAAERGVLATFRSKEAAELALLPQFAFTLVGGKVDSGVMSHLHLNPWLESANIGMTIPIYEGGALRAKINIATAQQVQALDNYGAVALEAFREVEDSLANEQLLAAQLPLDERALAERTEAVRIATIQYKAGRRDLLWVAQLQSVQIASVAQVIKLGSAQRANRVRLQQALGGSFDALAESCGGVCPAEGRR